MDSATASPEPESRRRSGRVVKAPTKYAPEPTAAAPKRKRNDDEAEDDGEVENGGVASDEDMSDAASDAESDHDHPAPKPRKAQTSRAKKPSTKKPKINGSRPAATGAIARIPSRPKKTVRIDPGEKGTGLFGMSLFHLYSLPLPSPLHMGFDADIFVSQPISSHLAILPNLLPNNGSKSTGRAMRLHLAISSTVSCGARVAIWK